MIYADSTTYDRISRRDIARRLNAALPIDPIPVDLLTSADAIGITEIERPDFDPATQRVVEGEPEQVDGEWRQTWVVEDLPQPDPLTQTLTKRQVNVALIRGGGVTDPDGTVEAAIAAIADETERALALNDWRHAPYYARDHQLFQDPALLAAMGLTEAQVDDLWRLGVTLPA